MSKAVIAIHGGAGAITRAQLSPEKELLYIKALSDIVEAGQALLAAGGSALDAVTEAVDAVQQSMEALSESLETLREAGLV